MTSKSILFTLILPIFALVVLITIPSQLKAQDCPFNIENCQGGCGRWIDADGDGICDRSVKKTTDTIVSVADTAVQTNTEKQIQNTQSNNNQSIINKNENTTNTDSQTITENEMIITEAVETTEPVTTKSPPRYRLILWSSLTIGAYLLSLLLIRLKVYTKKTHRRIWNILLLLTFLISGLLGLILVIQINYGIMMKHFLQFMKWHVDFGIGMALISIFHIIWHLKYFKNIFIRNSLKNEC